MSSPKKQKNKITDLETIVLGWAWEHLDMTKTLGKLAREFVHIEINWKKVKFIFEEPDYALGTRDVSGSPSKAPRHVQPKTLFKTHFTNNTDREQSYSFKAERITRSTCTIAVETGVTTGAEFGINLKTPCEVFEANAGFHREVTVINLHEDTTEEELTWGVDSEVSVPPQTEATAELVITEAQMSGSFKLRTRFSGKILVFVRNMKERAKDHNNLITVIEGDIVNIVHNYLSRRRVEHIKVEDEEVVCEVTGKCQFKYGIEQHVHITERKL